MDDRADDSSINSAKILLLRKKGVGKTLYNRLSSQEGSMPVMENGTPVGVSFPIIYNENGVYLDLLPRNYDEVSPPDQETLKDFEGITIMVDATDDPFVSAKGIYNAVKNNCRKDCKFMVLINKTDQISAEDMAAQFRNFENFTKETGINLVFHYQASIPERSPCLAFHCFGKLIFDSKNTSKKEFTSFFMRVVSQHPVALVLGSFLLLAGVTALIIGSLGLAGIGIAATVASCALATTIAGGTSTAIGAGLLAYSFLRTKTLVDDLVDDKDLGTVPELPNARNLAEPT